MSNDDLQQYGFLFRYIIYGCKIYNIVKKIINDTINESIILLNLYNGLEITYYGLVGQRIESNDKMYIISYGLQKNNNSITQRYNLLENKRILLSDSFDLISGKNGVFENEISNIGNKMTNGFLSPLLIMKYIDDNNSKYIVRKGPFEIGSDVTPFSDKISNIKFLCINYKTPEMDDSIEIKLNKGMLIGGNELLTPSFVLYYLECQSKSYYFDKNYIITIFDSNYNTIAFGSNKYIEMDEDGYKLKENESIDEESVDEESVDEESVDEESVDENDNETDNETDNESDDESDNETNF